MELYLREFFRLDIQHEFYKNLISDQFVVFPFLSSKGPMKNFHIYGKLLTNRFSLSIGSRKKDTPLVNELEGLRDLYFWLVNKHEYLVNYTNLRFFDRMTEILYLSTGDGDHQLQQTNPVSDKQIISLRPLRFNVEWTESQLMEVRSAKQEVLLEFKSPEQSGSAQAIDLRGLGEGYYELWVDGELDEAFFATNQEAPSNCIGVIHLNAEDLIKKLEDGEEEQAVYDLRFASRSCFWEYEVALSDQRKIELISLEIEGKGELEFLEPRNENMGGVQDLQVFTSVEPKKLVDKLEEGPELIVTYSNLHSERRSEMIIKLPVADIKRVQTRADDSGEMQSVAPTLIYI